jgi:hypothetical protein
VPDRWLLIALAGCGRIGFDSQLRAPSTCANAVQDGDETGIDCGGSCPAACVAASCAADADCVTGSCPNGACELATAPPFWLAGPSLTVPRSGVQGGTLADGSIYVVGGFDAAPVASVDRLAAGATSFAPAPPLTTARDLHAVVLANDGTLYAFGGTTIGGGSLQSIEAFGGAWTTRTPAPSTHSVISGASSLSGELYFIDINQVVEYSPATDSWTSLATPPVARDGVAAVRLSDGRILAIGGETMTNTVANVDALDPTTGMWTALSPLGLARHQHGAILAPDGRVYVMGGFVDTTAHTAAVEAYTPARDSFVAVAPLAVKRRGFATAIAPDGRLFAMGGDDRVTEVASVEVYGPVVALAPASAAPGAMVAVTGSNFAASAAVAVTLAGVVVASGVTDANGNATLDFAVPNLGQGTYKVAAIDARSQYPVAAELQIIGP